MDLVAGRRTSPVCRPPTSRGCMGSAAVALPGDPPTHPTALAVSNRVNTRGAHLDSSQNYNYTPRHSPAGGAQRYASRAPRALLW